MSVKIRVSATPNSVNQVESRASVSFFFLNLFVSRYRKRREAFEEMEESDGERVAGSDTAEGTEERAIRAMPIVTTLSYVRQSRTRRKGFGLP
jgi:hypothetical protein